MDVPIRLKDLATRATRCAIAASLLAACADDRDARVIARGALDLAPVIVTPLEFRPVPCATPDSRRKRRRHPPLTAVAPPPPRVEKLDPVAGSYLRMVPPRPGMWAQKYR